MRKHAFGLAALALCLAPSLRADTAGVLAPNAKVEKVDGGFQFIEGPVWMAQGYLLFSDIPADAIMKWKPGAKSKVWRKPSGHTNGNTLDYQGRLLSCEHDRRVTRTESNGKITVLASKYEGSKLNSPNDVVVKSNGDVYFTDPPYGIKPEQAELSFAGVYRIDKSGKITLLVRDFVRPNGIAFSPDEKLLYVNDTEGMHIRVFAVKPDGTLGEGRVFAELKEPGTEGAPDGMKTDVKGNVYCTGPGGVWVFAPSGKLLAKIRVAEPPANCAFGDSDFKTLYMTSRTGLYRIRLQNAGVRPGVDKPRSK